MKKLGLGLGLGLFVALLIAGRQSYKTTITQITAPNQSPLMNFPAERKPAEKTENKNSQVRRQQLNAVEQEDESLELRQPAASQRRLGFSQDVKVSAKELSAEMMNGRGWYFASELRARTKDRFNNEGEVVERIGPFVIYNVPPETVTADQNELSVIYRPDRHRIAILLGRLNIQLKDMNLADEVAQMYDLVIEVRKPNIRYIIARPNSPSSLITKADVLSKDKLRVVSVQLETSNQDLGRR